MPDTYFLQTKLYFGVQNGKFGSVIKTRNSGRFDGIWFFLLISLLLVG